MLSQNDCVCPDGKCHQGRQRTTNAKKLLCKKCITLWFEKHLKHTVRKMLDPDGAESKCIAMRSLLQFLGLRSSEDPSAKTFELKVAGKYWDHSKLAGMRNPTKNCKITYEIRADNLGGKSFDDADLNQYKSKDPEMARLLARFLYGVNVSMAHITWGANHSDSDLVWNINDHRENQRVVVEICNLLQERVYGQSRKPPWDSQCRYTGPR